MKKIILLLTLIYNFSFALVYPNGWVDNEHYIYQDVCYERSTLRWSGTGSSGSQCLAPHKEFNYITKEFIYVEEPCNYKTTYPQWSWTDYYYYSSVVDMSVCQNILNPTPTCTENEELVDGQCVCKVGYSGETCEPDITCPEPMLYEVTEAWHGYWAQDKRCVPNPNMSESECLAINGAKWGNQYNIYGTGCYIENYSKSLFVNNGLETAINFIPFSPLWNSSEDLVVQAVNKLFASGKNSFNAIKSKFDDIFASNPEANLQNMKLEYTDLYIGSDGIYYVADLKQTTPTQTADDFLAIYNKFRDNGWDMPIAPGGYDPSIHDPLPPIINQPSFPSVVNTDNLYLGGDALEIKSNSIISKNILDDFVVFEEPSGSLYETQIQTVPLKSNILKTATTEFNLNSFKIAETQLSDRLVTEYTSMIHAPDNSLTTVNTKKTKLNDGSSIYDVEVVTPIETPSGTKTLTKSYTVTKDSTGAITNNTYNTASTITHTTTTGATTTTTNSTSTTSTTISSTQPAVDLSSTNAKLDDIISKINEFNNYKPENYATYETAPARLANALTEWEVGVNSALDFVDGLKSNINDLINDFENLKNVFEDKPTMSVAAGTCPFQANWIRGTTTTVNPCEFISPYKPILSLFFTMLFTMYVLAFAFKYLFNLSLGGGKK